MTISFNVEPLVSSIMPREKRLISELARRYADSGSEVLSFTPEDLKLEGTETVSDLVQILRKLAVFDLVTSISDGGMMWVANVKISLVHERLEMPTKRNYFNEINDWMVSRKWTTAIIVFSVVLPLLMQWGEIILKVVALIRDRNVK